MSESARPKKIHVAHILVQHEYEAQDLAKKIATGSDFSEMAAKFSSCPSRQKGGDLGEMATNRLNQDFVEAAIKLQTNEVSGPIRTRFGWHLIKKIS